MTGTRVLYGLFLSGVFLSQYSTLRGIITRIRWKLRMKRELAGPEADFAPGHRGGRMGELQNLIEVTGASRIFAGPESFLLLSGALCLGMGAAGTWIGGLGFGLVTGGFFGGFPYLVLKARIHERRTAFSREGDTMIRELTGNYKIHKRNMKEAIEITSRTLTDAPYSRRLLQDLASGFNHAYTNEEIREVLGVFQYALGTFWGKALSQAIYFAQVEGMDVGAALDDLAESLIQSRRVIEHARREHTEAALMLRYLAPVSYLMSVICAIRFFGFTPEKYIAYQFGNALGLKWFLIVLLFFISGCLLDGILSRERMDL